ncbi:MsnO8 family LLM class oxidoreductase [Staphylococcus canis]|uniref:MsnO8 family LLM class oxidoreductase n=1 Tax=Staphylococcus canis TaxID=2724942 RepID=A0ABS0TAA1_9STAP|nr:MsnO8 family LLM class oxidoreductase [Staphylococcus canis]MBI5974698.1 MsnO8 family LLM class oxidoreductase [Staphylococcus canis]
MRLSILDYSPIFEGRTATDALRHTVELAQYAESLGYYRYWLAEHHKVSSVATSAPEILATMLLEQTSKIRMGAGGIMLPHYSAYKMAEIFKMLEARHPGRTDIALGHSKSYHIVHEALNEGKTDGPSFDQQLEDLYKYFNDDTTTPHRFKTLVAMPQTTTQPQIAILGSSENSAKRAGRLGAIFVFAPLGQKTQAKKRITTLYRNTFLEHHPNQSPYLIVSTFVLAHQDDAYRQQLENSLHYWLQRVHYLKQPEHYDSPESIQHHQWSEREKEKRAQNEKRVISGNAETVQQRLQALSDYFEADEILVLPQVFGEANRKKTLELIAPLTHS